MKLIGQGILDRFKKRHPDARIWIENWASTVTSANWQSIEDVRKTYSHADGVKLRSRTVVTVFNCRGNDYRLLTLVVYAVQTIQVLDLLPHAEYSKGLWKQRY
jgi:mRNA interferase HigB